MSKHINGKGIPY
jgi:hypothetical protein